MIKKHIRIFSLLSLFSITTMVQAQIKYILIDPSILFKTSEVKAAGYVGVIASMRYKANKGEFPNQKALFSALKKIKGQSIIKTYNDNLAMPSIFCDWLLSTQSNAVLKAWILAEIKKLRILDIEKEVFSNVVEMMLTPAKLIDTLSLNKDAFHVLQSLSTQGVTIILAGNWDSESLATLRSQFSEVFRLIHHVVVSGDIKQLKPSTDFYQHILEKFTIAPEECISIESEQQFVTDAQNTGMHVILSKHTNKHEIKNQLAHQGVHITV